MAQHPEQQGLRKAMERIEFLLREVERFPDARSREQTREIVQTILDLHGAALERILEQVADTGEDGLALIDSLARDDRVGSVLLLHGLHPLGLETRVWQALDRVQPFVRSHGGSIELLGIVEGVVRLRLGQHGEERHSPLDSLKPAIEEAIFEKAPDVVSIEIVELAANGQKENRRVRMALPTLNGRAAH